MGSAFQVTAPSEKNGGLAEYSYTGMSAKGWLACPSDKKGKGPWQIFANIEGLKDKDMQGGKVKKCVKFVALAPEYKGQGVWEYI